MCESHAISYVQQPYKYKGYAFIVKYHTINIKTASAPLYQLLCLLFGDFAFVPFLLFTSSRKLAGLHRLDLRLAGEFRFTK
jgi:hypothetical protein